MIVPNAVRIDESIVPPEVLEIETKLRDVVAGQERGVTELSRVHETYIAGMQPRNKPMAVYLLIGPTGSGKTHIVKKFSEIVGVKLIKVDCAEFQQSHEIAKLIGSPPGYVGGEIPPVLTKSAIEEKWSDKTPKYTVVLFDEIEKGNTSLQQILLGIMDEGTLTTGKNEKVDLKSTIIVMTSNIGSGAIKSILDPNSAMGFISKTAVLAEQEDDVYKSVKNEVKRVFSPEFFNRLDRMIVFRPLSPDVLKLVLEMELKEVQDRILLADKFVGIEVTPRGKEFLIKEGTSLEYGARELRRTIERFLVRKLVRAFAARSAVNGDVITVDAGPAAKSLSLFVTKGVMNLPEPIKTENTTFEKKETITRIDPLDPEHGGPYQNPYYQDYCGRCGYGWNKNHRCSDLSDDAFQRFKKTLDDKRKKPDGKLWKNYRVGVEVGRSDFSG
jgi:ATP-dependent Clp protease ATP-binding subunit ClpA